MAPRRQKWSIAAKTQCDGCESLQVRRCRRAKRTPHPFLPSPQDACPCQQRRASHQKSGKGSERQFIRDSYAREINIGVLDPYRKTHCDKYYRFWLERNSLKEGVPQRQTSSYTECGAQPLTKLKLPVLIPVTAGD